MNEDTNANQKRQGRMSRLTCTQCEGMLLDAADDLLLPEERTHFDLHLADCPACTRLFADVQRGGAWMDMLKSAPPVPPEDMVSRILAQTSGDPVLTQQVHLQAVQAQSLLGGAGGRVLPFRMPETRTRRARMMHTVAQPRFAMTAAMAFFSLALTMNLAGVKLSALSASDLRPANVRRSFWNANGRVVRYYDNLRVVYELESRVREMQRESDSDPAPRRGLVNEPHGDQQPQRQPNGSPHSQAPHNDQPQRHDGGRQQSRREPPAAVQVAAVDGSRAIWEGARA